MSISGTGQSSTKTCTQCSLQKPRSEFRKYAGVSPDGLRPLCSACQRDYEAGWRARNTSRIQKVRQSRAEKNQAYQQKYNAVHKGKLIVAECRRRSAKKGFPFDLDQHVEEIEARIQAGTCEMTGLPFELHARRKGVWNSPSIDRIEPAVGYLYHNIRVICFVMNAAMHDWGEERLRLVMQTWLGRA